MRQVRQIGTSVGWWLAPDLMIARSGPRTDPGLEQVYLRRGLVLVHIPKNAGTSVEDALFGYRVRHRTWHEISIACPQAWQKLPKIAILRDPVDRFLSAYDYLKAGGRNETDRRFAARMIGVQPIDAFVGRMGADDAYRHTVMRFFHFRRQSDYICDRDKVMVDTLIPFQRMAEGLTRVAGLAPGALVHANRTTGPRTRRSDLTQAQQDQIRGLYAADTVLFDQVCKSWDPAPARKAVQTPHVVRG